MKRTVDMSEISDGKFYTINDMAKLGCQDCAGCSACCRGMGTSIVLDPLDVFRLSKKLSKNFEALLQSCIELNVVDGIVLPNLKMVGKDEACTFLNSEGRCSIHDSRPGICRLFPLGRYYEGDDYKYFLQVNECHRQNRTKVKISKWLDTPDYEKYKKFILKWHEIIKNIGEKSVRAGENEAKNYSLLLLKTFYLMPYDYEKDFYEQFEERMNNKNL